MTRVAAAILRSRALFAERGWTRRPWGSTHHTPRLAGVGLLPRAVREEGDPPAWAIFAALRAVARAAGTTTLRLAAWMDARTTLFDDVIAAYDRAIEAEERS